jgi:eukaryotic-like serine/threonine-protein kinase
VSGIYQGAVGGTGGDERLFASHTEVRPTSWSPDGRFLLFDQTDPKTAWDIWVLPTTGDRTPYPYLASMFSEVDARFSPDGKWVAYTSDESGRDEVYIRSFPAARDKTQVSTVGGTSPQWAPGGRELFFLSIDGRLMAGKVQLGPSLQVGMATPLFDARVGSGTNRYAVSHNGERFLLSMATEEGNAAPVVVVLNWAEHLALARGARWR